MPSSGGDSTATSFEMSPRAPLAAAAVFEPRLELLVPKSAMFLGEMVDPNGGVGGYFVEVYEGDAKRES